MKQNFLAIKLFKHDAWNLDADCIKNVVKTRITVKQPKHVLCIYTYCGIFLTVKIKQIKHYTLLSFLQSAPDKVAILLPRKGRQLIMLASAWSD